MISSVRGMVLHATGSTVVIEVGGVGLAIAVTPQQALSLRVGSETRLQTALVVREDDLALFGFSSVDELQVFDLLRGVTGVGPKSALGVLAAMTPAQIATAVDVEDDGAFRRVSGIGPKTAKLIVVSLAGKLQGFGIAVPQTTASPDSVTQGVLVALVGLGWSERVAAQTVDEVIAEVGEGGAADVQALLRAALSRLGPQAGAGVSR